MSSALEPAGIDPVLDQLLPQRVAVEPEELRGLHLVAARLPEHGAQERLLHEPEHQVVEGRARVLAEAADALGELLLDDLLERRVRGHRRRRRDARSEEHTSELQSLTKLVCRLLLEKKKA